jgi:pimeloyl-ACP methyl ester carboxylesterase
VVGGGMAGMSCAAEAADLGHEVTLFESKPTLGGQFRLAMRVPGKMAGPWPVIETPTLIVWGEEDAALGIELLDGTDAYVPDLTIKRLPGVSHWVQQEAPEKVNAILKDWLPVVSVT